MFKSFKSHNLFNKNKDNENHVKSPISGKVVSLSEVNDPVFSSGMMGKGIAVYPIKGRVVSPIRGKVVSVFETKHAITLVADSGAEIIIHVGLETVNLNGQFFNALTKSGDKVKPGTPLLEFEMDKIKELGYDLVTPVIICNPGIFKEVVTFTDRTVQELEVVIELEQD